SIVHISDIHLSETGSPVVGRTDHLAAAICEAEMQCRNYIIVLSGDVANQGSEAEYAVASSFLSGIKEAIKRNRPGSAVQFVSIPGNHDCVLPDSEVVLRGALIDGLRSTLHTGKPDPMIMKMLLECQKHYFTFAKELFDYPLTDTERLCGSRLIDVPGGNLLFNLFNTALLSRRNEQQGIMLPIEVMRSTPEANHECSLSIAVFHHPYYWLEPNDGIEFRNHIDRTSDFALTGHQHVEHGFLKQSLSGEIVFYSEGHVLQEPGQPGVSAFRVIVLDLEHETRRVLSYDWNGKQSIYSPVVESDWTSYSRPHSRSVGISPSKNFLAKLSDSGIGLTHSIAGPLTLDTFFVCPDVSIRKVGSFDVARDLSGSLLFEYIASSSRIIIEGSAFAGKSALAQTLAKEWLRTRSYYPLLISG
ncbi:MAG: metallophosphoesterase family protein, partial [Candidatus Micrarchaeaceae archaeon]